MTKIVALAAERTFFFDFDNYDESRFRNTLHGKMVKKAIRRSQATVLAHVTPGKMQSDAEGTGSMPKAIGRSAKKTKNAEKCRGSYAGAGILKRGPGHTTRAKFDPKMERQRHACAEKVGLNCDGSDENVGASTS